MVWMGWSCKVNAHLLSRSALRGHPLVVLREGLHPMIGVAGNLRDKDTEEKPARRGNSLK